jgi:menaquinone-dependent protoporphyrinogen IX oxidase
MSLRQQNKLTHSDPANGGQKVLQREERQNKPSTEKYLKKKKKKKKRKPRLVHVLEGDLATHKSRNGISKLVISKYVPIHHSSTESNRKKKGKSR